MDHSFAFGGLVFWGSEHLPDDVPLGIDLLRQWALDEGIIVDDGQFIANEEVDELSQVFSPEDKLMVLLHLFRDRSGNLNYFEYPFIPVQSLIRKGFELYLLYWRVFDSKVEFGFMLNECPTIEFASESYGMDIVPRFKDAIVKLKNESCDVTQLYDGDTVIGEEIDVSDIGSSREAKAVFTKLGRRFSVEIQLADL